MDFDFSDLRKEILQYDAIHARAGGALAFGADELAHKIAKTLKPYLDEISADSPKPLLGEMDYLYKKMVEFSPYKAGRRMVQGQFYSGIGQFAEAASSFYEAYDIESDPTYEEWPFLQATVKNAEIMIYLGHSLYHAGETDIGTRYFTAGQSMLEKVSKPQSPENRPEPR